MFADMSPMTIRLTVSEILDERGISTSEFADKAKLTYGQALAIRRGVYERIDLGTIAKICEALAVEPSALFTSAKPVKNEIAETT